MRDSSTLDARRFSICALVVSTTILGSALILLSICSSSGNGGAAHAHGRVSFLDRDGSHALGKIDQDNDKNFPRKFLSLTSERGVELLRRHVYHREAQRRAASRLAVNGETNHDDSELEKSERDFHRSKISKMLRLAKPVARMAIVNETLRDGTLQKASSLKMDKIAIRNSVQSDLNSTSARPQDSNAIIDPSLQKNADISNVQAADNSVSANDHPQSRLFQHFDADNDGQLSEKEVANLLKQLTRKRREDSSIKQSSAASTGENRAAGVHDISIDGETLNVGDSDFDMLFKQLSNLKQTKDPSKDPRMTLQEDIIFVKDLVIVFFAATIGGVIARQFCQPALIGFLIGGMIVGPGGMGIVTELVEVETLASVGIAFLLFSLGIEFSISELQSVRKVVVAGGILSMFAIVVATGVLSLAFALVKTVPEAIALGLAVSLSSTAVVLQCLPGDHSTNDLGKGHGNTSALSSSRAPLTAYELNDEGATSGTNLTSGNMCGADSVVAYQSPPDGVFLSELSDSKNTSLQISSITFDSLRSRKVMLGLLVFQDVMIGLILALLPTLQGTLGQFIEEFVSAILRLGCFVMLCLILGEFVLPVLADRVERARSQEVFTMGCVVFCLAMAYLSERMGLAIELGAFAAGIMLSDSRHKRRAEESVEGIRTVFTSVFFISVGMVIHWRYFYQNLFRMLVLLGIVLSCKAAIFAIIFFSLGSLPFRTSLACGAAISQAGEFTFVVASKGQALMLFSASEARMINGATALSMLATPVIIRYARMWSKRAGGKTGSHCAVSRIGDTL